MTTLTLSTWEGAAVVATAILTAVSVVHAVTPRPRLRTFYDRPHHKQDGTWVELGAFIYVMNVGRAPAIIRSAGLRGAQGGVTYSEGFPVQFKPNVTPGTTPLVLQPGALVVYWSANLPEPGTREAFGVLELRTWRFARAVARWPAWARRALPEWARHKWHPAQGPARATTGPTHTPTD